MMLYPLLATMGVAVRAQTNAARVRGKARRNVGRYIRRLDRMRRTYERAMRELEEGGTPKPNPRFARDLWRTFGGMKVERVQG